MSTTITIYFSESLFRLVLLVRKSSRSYQLVNSQKKRKTATLPRTHNLGLKVTIMSRTRNLKIRMMEAAEDVRSNY